MNSKFINIPEGPVDPILGLNIAFKNGKFFILNKKKFF